MKVHQFTSGLLWDPETVSSLLTLGAGAAGTGCKRLRPLAPKLSSTPSNDLSPLDLKTFIKPENGATRKVGPSDDKPDSSPPVETHPGGTRWNPTQEQIGILEMLYRGGMRTPNAQQIEQITAQLGKYGKIEGKNVFYWFQNHKARERQKQKRNSLSTSPRAPPQPQPQPQTSPPATAAALGSTLTLDTRGEILERGEDSPNKRIKCRSWTFQWLDEEERSCFRDLGDDRTLKLFPLHPEGR